jgi:rhamnose transport system permease protein
VILLIIGVLLVAAVALPNIIGDVKKAVAMKKN